MNLQPTLFDGDRMTLVEAIEHTALILKAITFAKYVAVQRKPDGDKIEYSDPKGASPGLWGKHAVDEEYDEIVITEGEIDALSVAEASFAAVSMPNGAKNDRWIERDWQWLERHEPPAHGRRPGVARGQQERGRTIMKASKAPVEPLMVKLSPTATERVLEYAKLTAREPEDIASGVLILGLGMALAAARDKREDGWKLNVEAVAAAALARAAAEAIAFQVSKARLPLSVLG